MSFYIYNALPGQQVQINLALQDLSGFRADSLITPQILRLISPSITFVAGYPQNMIKLDTGLYYFKFTLPKGVTAVGNYLVNVQYIDPLDNLTKIDYWQIVVSAPAANFYISGG